VPIDTPAFEIVGPMLSLATNDATPCHMHIKFTNVRVPESTSYGAKAAALEISQVRLGAQAVSTTCMPLRVGRKHALDLMIERGLSREGLQKRFDLGKNMETISTRQESRSRRCRLMVLKAAKANWMFLGKQRSAHLGSA